MKKLVKKATVVLVVAWFLGNIPAWLFMPRHTTSDNVVHYTAIYYTMAPLALPFLVVAGLILFVFGVGLWEWAFVEEKPEQTKTQASVESIKELYVKDEIDVDQLANLVQKKMVEESIRRR